MRRTARILLAGWVGIAAGSAGSAAELPEKWKHWRRFREVRVETPAAQAIPASGELARVAIPEELFEEARSDLADLRLVDDEGDEVGYVLFARGRGPVTEWRTTELSDVGFVPGRYTQVVADAGEDGTIHNAVEVTLPDADEEFFTWVEVAASADRETWRIVRPQAPLYRFRDKGFGRSVSISYPRTRDRWLRLRLLRSEDEVAVERLRVAERVQEDLEFTRIRRGLTRRSDSPEGESWWEPQGTMPLVPIAAARVATQREAFHRPLKVSVSDDAKSWRQVGEGHIYRYSGEETGDGRADPGTLRQSLQVDVRNAAAPLWRVTILDRGDPPIADLRVTLLQNRRYVVFRAKPKGSYRLLYGNQRAKAPKYELAKLLTRDAQAAARLADLGAERTNDAWVSSDPFTERHPIILWAALGLAVLVLGGMALKALRS